jgi:DNA-binding response OmpR family regulator
MKRAVILIGDATTTQSVRRGLAELGYDTEVASSAVEGLSALQGAVPHLLVLDLGIDEGGGLAVLQVLRRSRSTRGLPVLVLGPPGTELMETAHALDAAGPFVPGSAASLQMWVEVATSSYSSSSSDSYRAAPGGLGAS